jgi:hypothetical protein
MGTKRASPGAEDEKSPLQNAELSDEDAKKLEEIQRDLARAELVLGEVFWNYERREWFLTDSCTSRTPGSSILAPIVRKAPTGHQVHSQFLASGYDEQWDSCMSHPT